MSTTLEILKKPAKASTPQLASPSKPQLKKTGSAREPPPPVPITYGCEHIKVMLESDPGRKHAIASYRQALRVVSDKTCTTSKYCNSCKEVVLRQTMLCLQCPIVLCLAESDAHSNAECHRFGVESEEGRLYCFFCHDFIVDETMETIRTKGGRYINGRKRRRLEEVAPTPHEMQYIETNTNPRPSRAHGLRGLWNLGQTCYLNVAVQALVHNPFVKHFYLTDGHRKKHCKRENCMSCGIEDVMVEFFASDRVEPFAPTDFLTSALLSNSQIRANHQEDAHEFMQFLLNDLHEADITYSELPKDNDKDCACFVHKLFYGKLQSEVTCERCKNVTTSLDPMMDLSLSLRTPERKKRKPKSRKDKDKPAPESTPELNGTDTPEPNGTPNPLPSPEAVFTLADCLDRYTKPERLGKDSYTCSQCGPAGASAEATKQMTIRTLAPVLSIQLKRFEHTDKGSFKIEAFVKFPPLLDMRPYLSISQKSPKPGAKNLTNGNGMSKPQAKNGRKREPHPDEALYELMGVVVHTSKTTTVEAGHYYAFFRVKGIWWRFDDEKVKSVAEEEVFKERAYLLYYVIRNLE
ncbi:cysteine proteinase [Ascobolus immersus RN42]|uniref:Cysteine proteinase n=1 Tax=Ascobolus immersus RN42 TaxID=1160509 RepID=A0A3N4IJZ8_ASCIM|nr:cysteine proteinase [Ascobolus immersus RN42]